MGPHDEFLELCAVSTSGDLTEEERKKLRFHLAGCAECQQAFREFEAAIDVGIPFLSSKLSPALSEESELYQRDPAESMLVSAATPETEQKKAGVRTDEEKREFDFAHRSGHRRTQADWNLVWLPFAACIFLTIALGVYGYRIGRGRETEVARGTPVSADARLEALEQQISDAGHDRRVLRVQLAQREKVIADLRSEMEQRSTSLKRMKSAQASLRQSIQTDEADKQRATEERSALAKNLDAAQASVQKMQAELNSVWQQGLQDQLRATSLEAQINDLSGQLRDREQTISRQDELL